MNAIVGFRPEIKDDVAVRPTVVNGPCEKGTIGPYTLLAGWAGTVWIVHSSGLDCLLRFAP